MRRHGFLVFLTALGFASRLAVGEEPAAVTEEEALASAREAEEAFADADRKRWGRWFLVQALVESALRGRPGTDLDRKKFADGLLRGDILGGFLFRVRDGGGSWSLLRVHQADGTWRALFRLVDADGQFDYQDFVLQRVEGRVVAVDVLPFNQGRRLSELLGGSFERAQKLVTVKPSELSGPDREYLDSLDQMGSIRKQYLHGNSRRCLEEIAALPASCRKDRLILTYWLSSAARVDEKEFTRAMEVYQAEYPDDPGLPLYRITWYLAQKQFDLAVEQVKILDERVGGDAYLSQKQGDILLIKGDRDAARAAYERSISRDKRLVATYGALIGMALQDKDWKEVSRLLAALERDAAFEVGDLRGSRDFQEYVETPEFETWMAGRKAREPVK